MDIPEKIETDIVNKDIEKIREANKFPEEKEKKKGRISEDKKKLQTEVDTEVKKAVDGVPMMKEYLRNRFALKNGDKPHLMKF